MRYVKRAVLVCGAATLLCWLFPWRPTPPAGAMLPEPWRVHGRRHQGRSRPLSTMWYFLPLI